MGSSRRGTISFIGQTPGPGSYTAKERLGDGPKYAMRPRTAIVLKGGAVPGPGQYTPSKQSVLMRPPSAVIGSGSRSNDFQSVRGVPGPGSYIQSLIVKKGPSFSFAGARVQGKNPLVPGPGTYRVPCTFASIPRYLVVGKAAEYEYV